MSPDTTPPEATPGAAPGAKASGTKASGTTAAGARKRPLTAADERWRDAPPGAHEWMSFPDPDEERTWLFDVTFLESNWSCIYGRGCQGVLTGPAPELEEGCCSYGAHFTGGKDARRVEAAAATLTADQWQFWKQGQPTQGKRPRVVNRSRSGELTTRLVKGGCIFLNRPGFPGGSGCALHRAAMERGVPHLELKPDVCWQLPLRREDEVADDGYVTTVIRQWDRRDWGAGGAEFHWWCTEAPDAFVGTRPVYEELAPELVALSSRKVYKRLVRFLHARAGRSATAAPADRGTPAAPAEPVPVFLPHPAVRRR